MHILKELTKNWTDEKKAKFNILLTTARAKKRKILFDQQDGKCHYCDTKTVLPVTGQKKRSPNLATLDHIIPACLGGGEHLSNFVLSCSACNSSRNEMEYEKYYALRKTPGAWAAFKNQRKQDRVERNQVTNAARKVRRMARQAGINVHDGATMEELRSMGLIPEQGTDDIQNLIGHIKHQADIYMARLAGHNGINLLHDWMNAAKWEMTQA